MRQSIQKTWWNYFPLHFFRTLRQINPHFIELLMQIQFAISIFYISFKNYLAQSGFNIKFISNPFSPILADFFQYYSFDNKDWNKHFIVLKIWWPHYLFWFDNQFPSNIDILFSYKHLIFIRILNIILRIFDLIDIEDL